MACLAVRRGFVLASLSLASLILGSQLGSNIGLGFGDSNW
jgi:hypothetical protein